MPPMTPPCRAAASLASLESDILRCRLCRDARTGTEPLLVHEPRPVLRLSSTARLVIASQAPGVRAHTSGVPFDDPSGVRLRAWMGLDTTTFYDQTRIAIIPMGFCFPGHDRLGGDLPPRGECRHAWHDRLFAQLPAIETILCIGLHSMRYHVARLRPGAGRIDRLTEKVAGWRTLFEAEPPRLLPLPHPSWRNSGWLKRNPWFEEELLPVLRAEVERLTSDGTATGSFSHGSMACGP